MAKLPKVKPPLTPLGFTSEPMGLGGISRGNFLPMLFRQLYSELKDAIEKDPRIEQVPGVRSALKSVRDYYTYTSGTPWEKQYDPELTEENNLLRKLAIEAVSRGALHPKFWNEADKAGFADAMASGRMADLLPYTKSFSGMENLHPAIMKLGKKQMYNRGETGQKVNFSPEEVYSLLGEMQKDKGAFDQSRMLAQAQGYGNNVNNIMASYFRNLGDRFNAEGRMSNITLTELLNRMTQTFEGHPFGIMPGPRGLWSGGFWGGHSWNTKQNPLAINRGGYFGGRLFVDGNGKLEALTPFMTGPAEATRAILHGPGVLEGREATVFPFLQGWGLPEQKGWHFPFNFPPMKHNRTETGRLSLATDQQFTTPYIFDLMGLKGDTLAQAMDYAQQAEELSKGGIDMTMKAGHRPRANDILPMMSLNNNAYLKYWPWFGSEGAGGTFVHDLNQVPVIPHNSTKVFATGSDGQFTGQTYDADPNLGSAIFDYKGNQHGPGLGSVTVDVDTGNSGNVVDATVRGAVRARNKNW